MQAPVCFLQKGHWKGQIRALAANLKRAEPAFSLMATRGELHYLKISNPFHAGKLKWNQCAVCMSQMISSHSGAIGGWICTEMTSDLMGNPVLQNKVRHLCHFVQL